MLKKCETLLHLQKLLTFLFSENMSVYEIFNDQSFNDTVTNDMLVLNDWALSVFSVLKGCFI